MQTHDLKIWPEHFRAVASGEKTVELRTDDRGYEVGDELLVLNILIKAISVWNTIYLTTATEIKWRKGY